MLDLIFPDYPLKIKATPAGYAVWDLVRKKFVNLTPEEWVRQHLIHHLIALGYPASMLQVEKTIAVNGQKFRPDLLAYLPDGNFLLLAECKAPHVKISQEAVFQSANYLRKQPARYLLLTNGLAIFSLQLDTSPPSLFFEVPPYPRGI